ncbi:hypothetical protein AB0N17_16220 [Streptomyces sp. NPDC051133]|uniref:DUF2207 family protein n=1 Tax=Streptomyces sp. NPDC051133 TaxID=3155521 RepID=UPI003440A9FD
MSGLRRRRVRALIVVLVVLAITGGILDGRRIAAGAGVALLVRLWELGRRTPRGSELWLKSEAFRRYPADPATCPGEPLDEERTDRYTAWAVALGVESAWQEAVGASTSTARRRSSLDVTDVLLTAVILSSPAPPSPSGSSGGGGGGSSSGGAGGGAGGGGSW